MYPITHILSCSPAHEVAALSATVLARYPAEALVFITEPRTALVQLRMAEGVAESQFNAGEILVSEALLELAGHFGFGMVIGRDLQHATALAILDAALRMPGDPHADLRPHIDALSAALAAAQERRFAAAAATRVVFDTF
ncbi:phosphonate C-P lyase system protein PhnG [Candidatus Viridilinea mediisalina]|uniref:Phosphonate C-P lyase system protein PhnG n=1 Tax=Candidatus Viridilinea mediisalina TaxID=2024553 RepID=A0A2A6RPV0_9CHLR|nr:phosphonate C-P lyase system protein PhnG [Candidatus Viridilinea mediisalina]PDW04955.1 phosphonate C-P lyase system protein PhnG [Candidatus Viridilinea mediisalina]